MYAKSCFELQGETKACGDTISHIECIELSLDYWKNRATVAEADADRLYELLAIQQGLCCEEDYDIIEPVLVNHRKALEARK